MLVKILVLYKWYLPLYLKSKLVFHFTQFLRPMFYMCFPLCTVSCCVVWLFEGGWWNHCSVWMTETSNLKDYIQNFYLTENESGGIPSTKTPLADSLVPKKFLWGYSMVQVGTYPSWLDANWGGMSMGLTQFTHSLESSNANTGFVYGTYLTLLIIGSRSGWVQNQRSG